MHKTWIKLVILVCTVLFGCVPQYQNSSLGDAIKKMEENQQRAVFESYQEVTIPFSEKQAAYINKAGKNSISGQGMLKTRGGHVKTSAGNTAYLYPKTEYTDEMMLKLFGNNDSGINQVFEVSAQKYKRTVTNLDRTLDKYTKKQVCDAQGNFEFAGIPNGEYYVVTGVEWEVPSRYAMGYQGGDLMQRVSVKNGEKKRIILTSQ